MIYMEEKVNAEEKSILGGKTSLPNKKGIPGMEVLNKNK